MVTTSVKVLAEAHGTNWACYNADCVEFAAQMPESCTDISIYSPPFANLFVYSDSVADMGNCASNEAFAEQYRYLIKEMFRVTRPGRMTCVHCIDIPLFKWKNGEICLSDFSGDITRIHREEGWLFHSRITIWKDPVTEMQRTKTIGLLHKQLKKDSCMSRVGIPDYVLVFRKPGENTSRVEHTNEDFPVEQWQQWASPVWMDIRQTHVLEGKIARAPQDEKHICPLQLDVIERCLVLWSNPGETVWSPFMGIGSEGYQAIKYKRKFIGTELKRSYFDTAVAYLTQAEAEAVDLFDYAEEQKQ